MSSAAIWDAGILIPGSVTSLVFPLDDPNIETAEDVVAITSSCECTTAEPLNYWDDDGRRKVAIRIHMLEESGPTVRASTIPLAVLLTIKTRYDDVIERTVRVLLSEAGIRRAAIFGAPCRYRELGDFLQGSISFGEYQSRIPSRHANTNVIALRWTVLSLLNRAITGKGGITSKRLWPDGTTTS